MDESKRRTELNQIIQEARRGLNGFDDAKRFERNQDMAGRCFRTRNCYSCPKKPGDYWWLYLQVTEVSADGYLTVWTFEQCKYGHVRIDPPETRACLADSYEEITASQFCDAWHVLEGKIQTLPDSAPRDYSA